MAPVGLFWKTAAVLGNDRALYNKVVHKLIKHLSV